MHLTLIGGGWEPAAFPSTYGPFLDAAGATPRVACVVVDEGDGDEQFRRWEAALTTTASCIPVPVLVPLGGTLDVASLDGADAVLVCGGLTPAYAEAVAPAAGALRAWLDRAGVPYAGFSAGAVVAADRALVGGWRDGTVPVCPDDAGEDLDQVTVRPGLGLVPFTVDVHCAQWGTLPRLLAVVQSGIGVRGACGLDEDTALHVFDGTASVRGLGAVHRLVGGDGGTSVVSLRDGAAFDVD